MSSLLIFRSQGGQLAVAITIIVCAGAALAHGADPDLVDVRSVDPTIAVELRYAGTRNLAGRALYPRDFPALVRPSVARKLAYAHGLLRTRGYGLKIWDAYRPKSVHEQLWQLSPNNKYVADPRTGGSLHTRGVAVDATLVDLNGRELAMPTDFDEFKPAAMLYYAGKDELVRRNLRFLQAAFARAGFYGLRTEWWHFVVKDWQKYKPIDSLELVGRSGGAATAPATETTRGSRATSSDAR